jgi:signal peptidase I
MASYFSLLLVILTLATGLIWLVDSLFFAPKRKDQSTDKTELPAIVDTSQQIFPVIAFVLVLRSFLFEPFQIPSGSMMPTLLVGDFILVKKFAYGVKDPVFRKKLIETGEPERGEIVVFKFPEDPRVDYIKRVVGLPGDRVVYKNKQIFIQPKCDAALTKCEPLTKVNLKYVSNDEFIDGLTSLNRFTENLGEVTHDVLRHPRKNIDLTPRNAGYFVQPGTRFNEWEVPEGHYFVMGDNRDNSADSRFWGFVPDENLVGEAVAIWISFEFGRDPESFFSWVPTGVRFDRVGGID